MKRTSLLLLVVFGAMFFAPAVRADTAPSAWERARDPEAREASAIHRAVEQRLIRTAIAEVDFGERERVLAMLEHAGAERSKQAVLRFDLGQVYFLLENHTRAAQVLKAALAEFPDAPAAERGWMRLALACGHIGDHECEQKSYAEVLRLETEELRRVTPTLNLAETRMHLGDLQGAIDDYREVARLSARLPASETAPLAIWGLAVALDRSGDNPGGEREARFAMELERQMGLQRLLRDKGTVFFVPDYEIHWYEGLGAGAIARVETSARHRAAWWHEAEKSFSEYVKAAERKNDRWLPIAKARLRDAKVERERAEVAAAKEPRSARDKDVDL
jgi:tetratricopeptide (TPR) repeat protein